jgi:hypothetical protein
LVKLPFLLVENFPLLFKFLLVLGNLLITFSLDSVELLTKPFSLILELFKFLTQVARFRHLVSTDKF